jgi:hypothetical protein
MLLDLKVDGAGRGIRKEVLQFLRVHLEMTLNGG